MSRATTKAKAVKPTPRASKILTPMQQRVAELTLEAYKRRTAEIQTAIDEANAKAALDTSTAGNKVKTDLSELRKELGVPELSGLDFRQTAEGWEASWDVAPPAPIPAKVAAKRNKGKKR